MRIALLSPTLLAGPLRGLEREMVELANHLATSGHEVAIIAVGGVGTPSPTPRPEVPVVALSGAVRHSLAGVQEGGAPLFVPGLAKAVRGYDVVVVYNAGWPVTLLLAGLGRRGTPPVAYRTYWHPPFGRRPWLNRLRTATAARAFARSEVLLAPTDKEAEMLRGLVPPHVRVVVVEPGVALEATPPPGAASAWPDLPSGAVAVTHLGAPSVPKGFEHSLEVVAELRRRGRDAHLLVVGAIPGDPTSARLVAEARALPHCHLLGAVPDAAKAEILARSDVVVVLSRFEAFSFVALEALRSGTVPIVWDDFPSAGLLAGYGVVGAPRALGAAGVADRIEALLADPPAIEPGCLRSWSAFGDEVAALLEDVARTARR